MRHLVLTVVAVVASVGWAIPMQADVIVDFSASPTTLGFSKAGNVDPDTMLNTSTGVWDVNLGGSSSYQYNSMPAMLNDVDTVYGSATIAFTGGSSNLDDRTIVFLAKGAVGNGNGYAFSVAFVPGAIIGYQYNATGYNVAVSNNDGLYHTYEWALNPVAKSLTLKFDGAPVGSTYDVGATGGNWTGDYEGVYFGDGTGGSLHVETWDKWSVGQVPEPSALVLLAIGLLCYAWRKRK